MNHYEWLKTNFNTFTKNLGLEGDLSGLISAHGDKCYQYKDRLNDESIPFEHGVAIFLLTYVQPYSKYVRETEHCWVAPIDWVCENYLRLKEHLPKAG